VGSRRQGRLSRRSASQAGAGARWRRLVLLSRVGHCSAACRLPRRCRRRVSRAGGTRTRRHPRRQPHTRRHRSGFKRCRPSWRSYGDSMRAKRCASVEGCLQGDHWVAASNLCQCPGFGHAMQPCSLQGALPASRHLRKARSFSRYCAEVVVCARSRCCQSLELHTTKAVDRRPPAFSPQAANPSALTCSLRDAVGTRPRSRAHNACCCRHAAAVGGARQACHAAGRPAEQTTTTERRQRDQLATHADALLVFACCRVVTHQCDARSCCSHWRLAGTDIRPTPSPLRLPLVPWVRRLRALVVFSRCEQPVSCVARRFAASAAGSLCRGCQPPLPTPRS